MKTILTTLVIVAFASTLFAEEREWTNLSGSRITAELTGVDGEQAVLSVNGKDYPVPIAKLSAGDRAFIAEWQKTHAATAEPAAPAESAETAAPAPESKLLAAMADSLVILDGRELVPFEIANPEKIEVLAFYGSASWCGPCQAFSPKLAKEYKSLKRKYDNFELVLLTSDRERGAWEEYIKDHKMPFPSVDFDKGGVKGKLGSGNKSGFIPSLLIKTVDGEVLDDAKGGAQASLDHLEDILKEYAKRADS